MTAQLHATESTPTAESLWSDLRAGLVNFELTIRRIVETKAWIPLGFETFAQAWDAQMHGMAVANAVKPYVIYAMLDEGLALEDISTTTGWAPSQVARANDDYRAGVPADGATVVRSHTRRAPRSASAVRVEFAADEFSWIRNIAKSQARDINAEARAAVVAHFEYLQTHPRTRRAR